ncbi:hypothetical protein Anapl_06731 [Anas platyrhynchos]|uniref:Uncharacterized protein n=1 Tax=Anas platyrhynchos TaxID=8839 RepID=R0M516_ANAPL|nr:hypothetical protein Anapl_06731 [Anas platyrhynchos]
MSVLAETRNIAQHYQIEIMPRQDVLESRWISESSLCSVWGCRKEAQSWSIVFSPSDTSLLFYTSLTNSESEADGRLASQHTLRLPITQPDTSLSTVLSNQWECGSWYTLNIATFIQFSKDKEAPSYKSNNLAALTIHLIKTLISNSLSAKKHQSSFHETGTAVSLKIQLHVGLKEYLEAERRGKKDTDNYFKAFPSKTLRRVKRVLFSSPVPTAVFPFHEQDKSFTTQEQAWLLMQRFLSSKSYWGDVFPMSDHEQLIRKYQKREQTDSGALGLPERKRAPPSCLLGCFYAHTALCCPGLSPVEYSTVLFAGHPSTLTALSSNPFQCQNHAGTKTQGARKSFLYALKSKYWNGSFYTGKAVWEMLKKFSGSDLVCVAQMNFDFNLAANSLASRRREFE